jgi:hypothetical protein
MMVRMIVVMAVAVIAHGNCYNITIRHGPEV